jgi:hypothetical protein
MTQPGWNGRQGQYDTSDVPQALARLTRSAPAGAEVIELSRQAASTRESGFFQRLLEDHFRGVSSLPARLKDATRSLFGVPGQEDTTTWGQVGDLSLPAAAVASLATILPTLTRQMNHVSRDHPTTFTLLTVVDFGVGWTGTVGEEIGVEVQYTIGVGQTKVLIKHTLPVIKDQDLFNGAQQVDTLTVPLMALQTTANIYDLTLLGAETPPRSIQVTCLASPVVY